MLRGGFGGGDCRREVGPAETRFGAREAGFGGAERFTRGVPQLTPPPKEVWIYKPQIVTLSSISGTMTQNDAQNRPETNDLDLWRDRNTPDPDVSELLLVVQ